MDFDSFVLEPKNEIKLVLLMKDMVYIFCFDEMSDYVSRKESNEVYDFNEHFSL